MRFLYKLSFFVINKGCSGLREKIIVILSHFRLFFYKVFIIFVLTNIGNIHVTNVSGLTWSINLNVIQSYRMLVNPMLAIFIGML